MASLNKYRKNLEKYSFLSTYDRITRNQEGRKFTELLKHREIEHYIVEQWVIAEIKKIFLALHVCMGVGQGEPVCTMVHVHHSELNGLVTVLSFRYVDLWIKPRSSSFVL